MGATATVFAGDTYKVDPVHSSTIFRVGHAGIGVIYGQFKEVSGEFTLDETDPTKSSFNIEVQAASVATNVDKRDAHLKSPDFLNVKQYPTVTFKSTSVKKVDDKHLEVTGDFTLHGVTKVVSFTLVGGQKAEFPKGTQRIGFVTELKLKRSDYGMAKMIPDVGDEVRIFISFEAVQK
jgi:polyisoprenoid-binding protein YceI